MAYLPNEWKDQIVQRPKTYQTTTNDDGSITLMDSFGLVTELGTPVNQDYMNHIEQGIAGCAIRYYSTTETFNANEVILNINENNEVELWKSLTDDNKNNPLTDTAKWEKVDLGGLKPDLTNLTSTGLDKLNQSKALETGSVSSDPDVYADIQSYAHSTFDLSKFTVVGGPEITEDGVASGFSNNDYINIPVLDLSSNDFQIEYKFTYHTANIAQNIFRCSTDGYNGALGFKVAITAGGSILVMGGTQEIIRLLGEDGVTYTSNLVVTSDVAKLYLNGVEVGSSPWSRSISTAYITIGSYSGDINLSIDLKSFAIWADGVPVFNGNQTGIDTVTINDEPVEIPYTLSKTGSKIVDVAYRDRVEDLYAQEGYAPYYTIDEENQNFTLPMGEIYGMIERKVNLTDVEQLAATKADKTDVDGQWVSLGDPVTLLSGGSLRASTSKTINISSVIPKDGYQYYVWISTEHYSSVATAVIHVHGLEGVNYTRRGQVANILASGAGLILVDTDRIITYSNGAAAINNIRLDVNAYCRKGKNV